MYAQPPMPTDVGDALISVDARGAAFGTVVRYE
jgi:hypothetical protein